MYLFFRNETKKVYCIFLSSASSQIFHNDILNFDSRQRESRIDYNIDRKLVIKHILLTQKKKKGASVVTDCTMGTVVAAVLGRLFFDRIWRSYSERR